MEILKYIKTRRAMAIIAFLIALIAGMTGLKLKCDASNAMKYYQQTKSELERSGWKVKGSTAYDLTGRKHIIEGHSKGCNVMAVK